MSDVIMAIGAASSPSTIYTYFEATQQVQLSPREQTSRSIREFSQVILSIQAFYDAVVAIGNLQAFNLTDNFKSEMKQEGTAGNYFAEFQTFEGTEELEAEYEWDVATKRFISFARDGALISWGLFEEFFRFLKHWYEIGLTYQP